MDSQTALFQTFELRRENLNEQIADMIQEMIDSQRLQVGDRLPSERELATLLNVNRATLREAIRILEQRGLVSMRVGSGTYVTQVAPDVVGQAIERYYASRKCSQKDLQAVRTVIEPEIAALAATNAREDDLTNLGHLLNRLEKAWLTSNTEELPEADADFHMALAVASHNELFIAIVNGLSLIMKQWINITHQLRQIPDSHLQHRRVYEAILARDPVRARESMQVHMATTPMVEHEIRDRGDR
jgi:DNA-binding FadR family transcriptional regulator